MTDKNNPFFKIGELLGELSYTNSQLQKKLDIAIKGLENITKQPKHLRLYAPNFAAEMAEKTLEKIKDSNNG